ncbi:glycoside hydrolase family 88 protein, partial [Acinetobacter soli]|uniref:glycoside hydrolase family 88 protein n=1 Tax=Acinetobacter soli TaxID=487316 RepID=UPI002812B3DD
LLKGARLGVLSDETYRRSGEQVLMGIALRKFTISNGQVSLNGICKGAGLGPAGNLRRNGTVEYYLSEDVVADEQKGVGVCMMAYAEYLLARKA